MKAILFVALGGMIGAVLRYLGSLGAIRLFGDGFAYGTLLVNVIGCLGIGFLARNPIPKQPITLTKRVP